jgi:hypothetical protein
MIATTVLPTPMTPITHPTANLGPSLIFGFEGPLEVLSLPGELFAGAEASADAEEAEKAEDLLDSEARDDAAG